MTQTTQLWLADGISAVAIYVHCNHSDALEQGSLLWDVSPTWRKVKYLTSRNLHHRASLRATAQDLSGRFNGFDAPAIGK